MQTFKKDTKILVFNEQENAIQAMIDYDYLCKKDTTSVEAIVTPGSNGLSHYMFGQKDILIPVYPSIEAALEKHHIDMMINFASPRSAFSSTMFALEKTDIGTITVLAEGVPERESRIIGATAEKLNKMVIGPSTVGGVIPGVVKIGNAGGTIQNAIRENLYKKGSVGLVSKSGGMLNEMMSMITKSSDGIKEAISVGGDRFPATRLAYHVKRMLEDPEIKLIVVLGEIGGTQENEVAKVISESSVKKTVIAHIIGGQSKLLKSEIQFGHAGAKANTNEETPEHKMKVLREAGVIVVENFKDLKDTIAAQGLKMEDVSTTTFPRDFNEAMVLGEIRYKKNIISSIKHDTESAEKYNLGQIICNLWLKKQVSTKVGEYIELILKLIADHGAAVSGAHNTIVTARAGKDLISSLISGLLTIGPRFGGAINDSARYFKEANDKSLSANEFVDLMKERNILIPGIGHKVKSKSNPDCRVTMIKEYVRANFKEHKYLDYALAVEEVTTRKKESLILNIDGVIANTLLDLFTEIGISQEELNSYVDYEMFNGLFVLGRSVGLIGHFIDQRRLEQPLYRHPEWDIFNVG